MKLAHRMSNLGTETAFEVLAKARQLEEQGHDIIHLEIGEPDFETPSYIVQAGVQAIHDGWTGYGPAAGLPQLQEAIAAHVSTIRHIKVTPQNVVVVPGAKPIIFYSILALVNKEDEVIYPNPGFPIYESMVNFVGGRAIPIPLLEEKNFTFDINDLAKSITSKTRLIILNSPQNPTGSVLPRADLEIIAELARKHDLMILSDEIYGRIIYDCEHVSIASLRDMQDRTIILDGFSKTYSMTGWRLGFGVMNEELAEKMGQLIINSHSCTASFTQIAGTEALRGPQTDVDNMIARFKRRRDIIVEGLNQIRGVHCRTPHGAFYAFPNIQGTGRSSRELADYLLEKAGVACLSGTAFGKYGEGYLRFSYANSVENIKKALERVAKVLGA